MTAAGGSAAIFRDAALVDPRFYIEISALGESNFTGVSQMAAGLCRAALEDDVSVRFMTGRRVVPKAVVTALLATRDGSLLDWYLARAPGDTAPLRDDFGRAVGIYPNRKFTHHVFDRELQIVHDLSTVLLPNHHERETVLFQNTSYREETMSNDLTLCPSDATAADVRNYIAGVNPGRVCVIPLGCSAEVPFSLAAPGSRSVERYVMVLGTLEPRKNLKSVLELLARAPGLLAAARFVFVGRAGWGSPMAQTIADLGLDDMVRRGRIVMTGFLPETLKDLLLRRTSALIYPSLFEGFGLPVLEAVSAGVPVVTTRSSSIPEAGGGAPFYFDPFIAGDIDRAVYSALFDTNAVAAQVALGRQWAERFKWATTWSRIKQLACTVMPLKERR